MYYYKPYRLTFRERLRALFTGHLPDDVLAAVTDRKLLTDWTSAGNKVTLTPQPDGIVTIEIEGIGGTVKEAAHA